MNYKDMISKVCKEENELVFEHFSNDDAYRLGTIIYEQGEDHALAVEGLRKYLGK